MTNITDAGVTNITGAGVTNITDAGVISFQHYYLCIMVAKLSFT